MGQRAPDKGVSSPEATRWDQAGEGQRGCTRDEWEREGDELTRWEGLGLGDHCVSYLLFLPDLMA